MQDIALDKLELKKGTGTPCINLSCIPAPRGESFLYISRGFIGQVESPNYAAKYNLNHLNILAREFKCSPKDFMPDKPL